MKREETWMESCTLSFDTAVYAKDKPVQTVTSRDLNAVRWLENGRLGAAAAAGPMRDELRSTAREMAAYGPEVGKAFFANTTPMAAPSRQVVTADVESWIHRLQERLAGEAPEFDYMLRATRRNLRLFLQNELVCETVEEMFHCSVAYRTPERAIVRLTESVWGPLPDMENWLQGKPWQREGLPQQSVPDGRYDMVFTPSAFAALFDLLLVFLSAPLAGLQGLPRAGAQSGEPFLHPAVTVLSHHGAGRLDDEGVLASEIPLVERGVWNRAYNDRYTAGSHRQSLTGNGYRSFSPADEPQYALPRPQCPFASLAPGEVPHQALIEGMDRGLVITLLSPSVNRDILVAPARIPLLKAWYVENGQVTHEVSGQPIMITGVFDLFRSALVMSADSEWVQGKRIPWVCAPAVQVVSPS